MSIEIDALTLKCRVPAELAGGDPRARVFLDRLLDAVRGGLPQALSSGFGDLDADERIAFIDSLQFQLTVNLDLPPEEIAHRLAAQLARCLWSKLSDPSTITFRDNSELWARFFSDLAAGCAYTRTWHGVFAGFKSLSTLAVARSLVETEPRTAIAGLCRLTRSDLNRVISHFSTSDARRAVAAATAAAVNQCHDPERIADVLTTLGEWRSEDPKTHLALVVGIERETGQQVGMVTLHLADTLMDLAQSADSTDCPMDSPGPAAEGGFAEPRRSATAALMPRGGPRKNRGAVGEAVSRLRPGRIAERAQCFEMREGGFWLVLAHVLEGRLQRSRVDGSSGSPTNGLAAAFAAGVIACGKHARAVWENRSLRSLLGLAQDDGELLFGIAESLAAAGKPRAADDSAAGQTARAHFARRGDVRDLRNAATDIGLSPAVATDAVRLSYEALRSYARRLPGFGTSSNGHLWKNFLLTPATVWCDDALLRVTLAAPALDVIWRICGAGKAAYTLPDGRFVHVDVRR